MIVVFHRAGDRYRYEQCVTTAFIFFMTIANTATEAAVRQRCVFP